MKKRALLFCLVPLICTSVFGEELLVERWVAHYNGPGSGYDGAHALVVDNSGNIYVTGESLGSGSDFCTIKYSPDSNIPLWVARYNGPDNNSDCAYAIALDSNENIYVTGEDWGDGTFHDYATIKYAPESNEPVWVARYNGPANADDSAEAIAVDSDNNIYVTGYSIGSEGKSRDSVTIKYDTEGNELWIAKYGSGNGYYYYTQAMAIDTQNNIYVTGYLRQDKSADYFTIKYRADSNQPVWMVRYNGPGNGDDSARAIATDNNNNIYVTGESIGTDSGNDYTTIKYDTNGNSIWEARYNGPGNNADYALMIAIDDDDNIYVAGASYGSDGHWDYATIKYTADSNIPVWVARYNGPDNDEDIARAIAIDKDNNIYVTGESIGLGTYYDCTTIKYDRNGNEIWVARYNRTGAFRDNAQAIAVDNENNVYVTGYSGSGSSYTVDYITIKYTQHGICLGPVTSDLNNDCKVDFIDYAKLAQYWLIEKDWDDLRILTDNWLECNYALEEDCR